MPGLEKPFYVRCAYKELMSIAEVKPNPRNPNLHPDSQIERFVEILKYTGIRKPIVVSNQSGLIVTGHGTLQACEAAGWVIVPVDYQDFESDDQEYAHMVADNALQQWSELDRGEINAMLENLGPNLNLTMFGIQDFVMDLSAERAGQPIASNTEEDQWEDPVQSESVRKIVLFYSQEKYTGVLRALMELSTRRGIQNMSDLIAELVAEAMK